MSTLVRIDDATSGAERTFSSHVGSGVRLQRDEPVAKRDRCGGKAAVLYELQDAGFRVPMFVVSPNDLTAAVVRLGTPLVVRSSATLEDSAEASFAGQFKSFLNLQTVDEVRRAVGACQASVHAPGVAAYCREAGIDPVNLRMEVIVQRMVRPELAGVAFTINPMTGAEEVVIEACEGLADDLLSGRQAALPADHPLVCKYRPEIERIALRIQRHFGAPQDIEFAIQDGVVYVLQARPITRIHFDPQIGEWTNADFRDGGVSCGVCSTLMWSLYELIWDAALKSSLRELHLFQEDFQAGRMFFGRPYWNLGAIKQCLAALPGFVEREFDNDLNVQILYDGPGRRTPVTLRAVLRAIPTLLAFSGYVKRQRANAERWLAGRFDNLEQQYEQLPDGDRALADQLRRLIEQDYFDFETAYFRTIYAVSLTKLDFKSSFPDTDFNSLVAALPRLAHMAPCSALRAATRQGQCEMDEDIFNQVVRQYRHQSLRGLDIRHPRWDEDRNAVHRLAEKLPSAVRRVTRPAYERALQDAISQVSSWRRRKFQRKLERLRRLVWLREEMRDLSSRMYYQIRRHVLEIDRRRGLDGNIFFMTYQQIFADDASQIEANREASLSYRDFAAPNEIGGRFAFDGAAKVGDLQGIAASPGIARGTARVAHSVEEAMVIEPGAVLVCPFTDPGWMPVLGRFAAVVTENGGLLSHAAVICREFGIPAVLGVSTATRRILGGSQVVVDGNAGTIELAASRETET